MSLTLEDIYAKAMKAAKRSAVYMVPHDGFVFTSDYSGHTTHVYIRGDDGMFTEIDLDLNAVALKLSEGMDKVAYMVDVLKTLPVEQLLEVKEVLKEPDAKVKSKGGCFNLIVSGGDRRIRMVLR